MNKKILITGGAGFIGYHLAFYHAGCEDDVTILDHLGKNAGTPDSEFETLVSRKNVHFVAVDLTAETPKLPHSQFDLVYHLAAINGTELFYEKSYELLRNNILITTRLLDLLEKISVGRLVYSSSSEVYAEAHKLGALQFPSDESTPVVFTQPTNRRFSYGVSKFVGEPLCLFFGDKYGVDVSVIRYHNIYGPRMGERHVVSEFLVRALEGVNPFPIYGGEEMRSYCYIDDAVSATAAVGSSQKTIGQVVHIGNPEAEISALDLAKEVCDLVGHKPKFVEKGRRSGSVLRRKPDISRLISSTGYRPKMSLSQGLQSTLSWYRGFHAARRAKLQPASR